LEQKEKEMALMVNIHEAKTHLSRLLEKVSEGEEVILAKAGKPIAKLVSWEEAGPRKAGMVKGRFDDRFFDPLPEEELKAWGQ
jgi:prevent-host-death family protein